MHARGGNYGYVIGVLCTLPITLYGNATTFAGHMALLLINLINIHHIQNFNIS